jgi:TetR/AcrR family tetracycline transcriptional repressor
VSSTAREPLSRERVVGAALVVIDRAGMDGCSMRAVASELGVEAMSLYHHVPGGKDEMLDGVVAVVQAQFVGGTVLVGEWRGDMSAFARAYRTALSEHRNVVPIIASRPAVAYRTSTSVVEPLLASLEAAGFSHGDALRAVRVFSRWIIGFSLGEASSGVDQEAAGEFDEPLLVEVVSDIASAEDAVFEFGLVSLLDGLAARLAA